MKIPYTQQFTPQQTPLNKLIPVLRQHTKNKSMRSSLKSAIASAFFKAKTSPEKLAGNTLTALRTYEILDKENNLTDLGKRLLKAQSNLVDAHRLVAEKIINDLDGFGIIETLRDMKAAGLQISLTSLPHELRQRNYEVSDNSSDLSGVLGWLREAKILKSYEVDSAVYESVLGATETTLEAVRDLNTDQLLFLKAMLALNVTDWTSYRTIGNHAEELYPGEVKYGWKDFVKTVLTPLKNTGLIEFKKQAKKDQSTPEGRGGKTANVRPTQKFETEFAEKLLANLYRTAGFKDIREIRGKSLSDIVADVRQIADANKRGRALEILAVRLCQMLDLEFMGIRETDIEIAGGGEVDAMLHSTRLVYSRWQVQCKVGKIAMETVAKEVGMAEVTLANVILIVSTGVASTSAETYRRKIVGKTNLNIIFLDGNDLNDVIRDNSKLINILRRQAKGALSMKPSVEGLKSGGNGEKGGNTPTNSALGNSSTETGTPERGKFEFIPAYSTRFGSMFEGDSLQILPYLIDKGYRAKLIITSPPFALVRKKSYGNEDTESYLRWFEQFIPLFKQVLDPLGSLVIDIGSAWIKGLPVKSVYQYELLIKLTSSGFYLAQDFYHYNPAKLPTPAEWVTIRRMRVKDAMNNVFWLTQDPFVDADNRRVLVPYSDSMKSLLSRGYKPAIRPSGHDISSKFQRDNGGAIPPNLLQYSNTDSQSHYLKRCKDKGIAVHPARFPQSLPDFFINFLTKPGDLVLDPFSGSNVTGASAEQLGRRWISIEMKPEYVLGSRLRFEDSLRTKSEPVDAPILPFISYQENSYPN